jgi:hypothetical protein
MNTTLFSLETNPSGRQFIRAKGKADRDLLVDVDLCEWIFREEDQDRYESEIDIVPVKITDGKVPIWINKNNKTGEDEKGWYYINNDNEKVYRYTKV